MNYYYYWIALASVIAILPVFLIKRFILTHNYLYILASLLCYGIMTVAYINLFQQRVGTVYTLLQVLQVLIVVVGSLVLFNEKIDRNKIIGISFGVLCIYFLQG